MDAQSIMAAIYRATQPQQAQPLTGIDEVVAKATPPPSIMQTLKGLISPQQGSYWNSALKHTIWDANTGLEQDRLAAADAQMKRAMDQERLIDLQNHDINTPTGTIARRNAEGKYDEVYHPAPNPSPNERLIAEYLDPRTTPERKSLLERVLPGYQYTAPVITAKSEAKQAEIRTKNATQRFAPRVGRAASTSHVAIDGTKIIPDKK